MRSRIDDCPGPARLLGDIGGQRGLPGHVVLQHKPALIGVNLVAEFGVEIRRHQAQIAELLGVLGNGAEISVL